MDGDDFLSCITRFEIIAELLKTYKGAYTVRQGTLLSGKAAKIYSSLSSEIFRLPVSEEILTKDLLQDPGWIQGRLQIEQDSAV